MSSDEIDQTNNDIELDADIQKSSLSQDDLTPYPRLEVLAGPQEGLVIALEEGEQSLGRSKSQNKIYLNDRSLSRIHAKIILESSQVQLLDLGSRNGTFLNTKKIKPHQSYDLQHLDQIRIGLSTLRFLVYEASEEDLLAYENRIKEDEKAYQEKKENDKDLSSNNKENTNSVSQVSPKKNKQKEEESQSKSKKNKNQDPDDDFESLIEEDNVYQKDIDSVSRTRPHSALPLVINPRDKAKDSSNYLMIIFLIICSLSAVAGLMYYLHSQKIINFNRPEDDSSLESKINESLLPKKEDRKEENLKPDEVKDNQEAQDLKSEEISSQISDSTELEKGKVQTSSDELHIGKEKTVIEEPKNQNSELSQSVPEKEKKQKEIEVIPVQSEKQEAQKYPAVKKPQSLKEFHAFLDVQAEPLPARIFFDGEFISYTPLKRDVVLKPSKKYEVVAQFDLEDIDDQYQERKNFVAEYGQEVFSIKFEPHIGFIKILRLPSHLDFYMEGYYDYDRYKANPVKIQDVVYGKPIYVPYGRYIIELREKVPFGDSDHMVYETRYQRIIHLSQERKNVDISVSSRDLQYFPARLLSTPSGATVRLNNEILGVTPYIGDIPLGKHQLKLSKEGYFDHEEELEVFINRPLDKDIELKTSQVGRFINKAKALRQNGLYQEALEELVSALKIGGTEKEKSEIYLLLGDLYYLLNRFEKSLVYFEQAKKDDTLYYYALLGMARVRSALGNRNGSLSLLVEILLNVEDNLKLKKETLEVFRQVSPLSSIIYIRSTPLGAQVKVNNQVIENQVTPMILSDLPVDMYMIEITKRGYQPVQIRKEVKVSEFIPIIVDLKPLEI